MMIQIKRSAIVLGVTASCAFALAGCSAGETAANEESDFDIAVETDGIQPRDTGTSWNGWYFNSEGDYIDYGGGSYEAVFWLSTFFKQSGSDPTRGGGSCVVLKKNSSSCTSDSQCLAGAVAQFGSEAWGYCSGGACYHRPGSQAGFCAISPNRTPGSTVSGEGATFNLPSGYSSVPQVLTCMTKTQGPNTACGGTDPSQYVRNIKPMSQY